MRFALLFLALLAPCVPCAAQQVRPYLYGGFAPSNAGYVWHAEIAGTGLDFQSKHVLGTAEIWVDNAHKVGTNFGYDFGWKVYGFYKFNNNWFAGGGFRWSEYKESRFTKQSSRPVLGLGKDIKTDEVRLQGLYVFRGDDTLNGLQGPELSLWIPSPSRKSRHFFWRQTLGAYSFHNVGTSNRGTCAFAQETIMWRF